jgi:hypothetical protein
VKLAIDAPTTRGPWTMRATNAEDVPVRIVADARLLWLEVTPRSARKAERCELPPDMRPADDLQRPLVLPPGRTYAEKFEPRLYCFGRRLGALAPGAIVVAHLGWTGRTLSPPQEVSAIDGVDPPVGPSKSIEALPVRIPDEPAAEPMPEPPHDDPTADAPRLGLQSAESVDAESAHDIAIPVTLRNDGTRSVTLRYNPETLAFDVSGPVSAETCVWPVLTGAPTRELFTTLPGHGTTSLTVVLHAYCGGHILDRSGLVEVRARLDTRKASGADLGLRTFDGEVAATTPTLVRLHRGAAPEPHDRPRLKEQ